MDGIQWALAHAMTVRVGTLPEGDDPDSFVRREGPAAMQARIDAAIPIHDWRFSIEETALGATPTPEARSGAVRRLLAVVKGTSDPVLHMLYRRRLARLGAVDEAVVARMLGEPHPRMRKPPGRGGVSL